MANTSFTDLTDALKQMRSEDLKFLDKYGDQIETLKESISIVNSQKSSWINRHKWFIVMSAIVLVVFVAPLVMKSNNVCQFNIKFNESIGFQRCK